MKDYKTRPGAKGSKSDKRRPRPVPNHRERPAREARGLLTGRPARPPALGGLRAAAGWLRGRLPVLVWGCCALWLAAGFVAGGWVLWRSPLQVVRLEGNARLEAAEVLEWGGLAAGMAMHQVDPYRVARRLAAHPAIERADVRRIYPGVAAIRIRERMPQLLLALADGRTVVLDGENVILATLPPGEASSRSALPRARGIPATPRRGARVTHPALARVRKLFATLDDLGFSPVKGTEVELLLPSRLALQFPGGHRLLLPAGRERAALALYRRLIARRPELLRGKSVLDFGSMSDEFGGRVVLAAARPR